MSIDIKDPGTLSLYIGVPGCGKTANALVNCISDAKVLGWPIVIIDSEGTVKPSDGLRGWNAEANKFLETIPTVESAIEASKVAWKNGQHCRFVPQGEKDIEHIATACSIGKSCIVLFDEAGLYCTPNGTPKSVERIVRTHRHLQIRMHITTQYLHDISPLFRNCASEARIYRNDDVRALELIEIRYGYPKNVIRAQGRGECKYWNRRFK